ncbi:hypothetical protein [Nonomuraea sp. NPDC049141]
MAAFKANKERMRTLRDLGTAAIVLREVWLKIRSVADSRRRHPRRPR